MQDNAGIVASLLELFHEAQAASGPTAQNFVANEVAVNRANLLAYLTVRQHDLADIQRALADLGLSSLGRMEGHVLNSLASVLGWLSSPVPSAPQLDRRAAAAILERRSHALFGRPRPERNTRIMVTLDHTAGHGVDEIGKLLLAGMDIARINCAHGKAEDWRRLASSVREAEQQLAAKGNPPVRRCHLLADLGGPKVRTGNIHGDIRLRAGDLLRLYRDSERAGHPAGPGGSAGVACTWPDALKAVMPGHPVFIDDGKFSGRVEQVDGECVQVRILTPAAPARRLKPEKGLNFPGSELQLPALTQQDILDLAEVAPLVDIIGLSFVHSASDIERLHQVLVANGRPELGVVAKIETRAAARNLTSILLAGLELPAFGVMIARGDLAVEVGFEDLAVVQENILCLCESAHIPAIWATQVLDTLARSGTPARAEVTDAAAGRRAECVMLNKGPYVVAATAMLDRLLTSEQRHREKKRDLYQEFMPQDVTRPG